MRTKHSLPIRSSWNRINVFLTCNDNSKHLYSTGQCFKPVLTYLFLTAALGAGYYDCPQFINEKNEAQRRQVISSRCRSGKSWNWDVNSGCATPERSLYNPSGPFPKEMITVGCLMGGKKPATHTHTQSLEFPKADQV